MLLVYCALPDFLDLTHHCCLGIDHDPEDDVLVKAHIAEDYKWGPADQVVELEDGVPAQGV